MASCVPPLLTVCWKLPRKHHVNLSLIFFFPSAVVEHSNRYCTDRLVACSCRLALISQPSSFFSCTIRQDIHHDWQRQQHAEPGHRALCHFLALQAHQRAQREDGDPLLRPSVGGGNLREGRGAEGPAVGGLNGKPAGRPVPGHPPERGSHLWNSGTERCDLLRLFLCSPILSFFLWVMQY